LQHMSTMLTSFTAVITQSTLQAFIDRGFNPDDFGTHSLCKGEGTMLHVVSLLLHPLHQSAFMPTG
jgi:hypothetical protein